MFFFFSSLSLLIPIFGEKKIAGKNPRWKIPLYERWERKGKKETDNNVPQMKKCPLYCTQFFSLFVCVP